MKSTLDFLCLQKISSFNTEKQGDSTAYSTRPKLKAFSGFFMTMGHSVTLPGMNEKNFSL